MLHFNVNNRKAKESHFVRPTEKQAQHYGEGGLDLTRLGALGKRCAEFLVNLLGGQRAAHTSGASQHAAYLRRSDLQESGTAV